MPYDVCLAADSDAATYEGVAIEGLGRGSHRQATI
jgi:hypothetical protein